jgi:hypothetical protein
MKESRESARRRVASFQEAEAERAILGRRVARAQAHSKSAGDRSTRRGQRVAGMFEMRAQGLVISGWVVNVCEVSLA